MKSPKDNPTVRHFIQNRPAAKDLPRMIHRPVGENRFALPPLSFNVKQTVDTDYEQLHEVFRTMPTCYRLFPDTCFITAHEVPRDLWDVIVDKHICITPRVWMELEPWRNNPKYNKSLRDYLVDAMSLEISEVGHPNVSLTTVLHFPPALMRAGVYYANLLRLRKRFVSIATTNLQSKLGREPTKKEIQQTCQKYAGERAWNMASKVLKSPTQDPFSADEETVLNAAMHSICSEVPSVVLTRDADTFDQFYKMFYLVDTHYHSMLLAEELHRNPDRFYMVPARNVENPFYEGRDNSLVQFNGNPSSLEPTTIPEVECAAYLISSRENPLTFSSIHYGASPDMRRLLSVKGSTHGRNTDLFDDRNYHICLDPRNQFIRGHVSALIRDRQYYSNDTCSVAFNDVELALFSNEEFSTLDLQFYGDDGSNR